MNDSSAATPAAAAPGGELARAWTILRLAVPVMAAMMTQTAVNFVDTIFLASLGGNEGSNAQAALGPSLPLLWAVGGFLSAISVGTQAIVARRWGQGSPEAAGRVAFNSALLASVAALVTSILLFAAIRPFYGLFFANRQVAAAAASYTQWRFVGLVGMVATASIKSFFDGIGKTWVHLVSAVLMNIMNAFLCWGLILGHLGLGRHGVAGAGMAAALSSYLGLAVMVAFTLLRRTRRFRIYRRSNFSWRIVLDIARLSVPSGVATIVVMTGFLLFMKIVEQLDRAAGLPEAVNGAATHDIIQILALSFFASLAFGTATATLVSQRLGARQPDEAERFAWTSVRVAVLVFGGVGLLVAIHPDPVLHLVSKSSAVVLAARNPLRLMAAANAFIGGGMVLTQALFGAGNTRFVMVVEMILHFTCLVPLAYVLGLVAHLGLLGIWASAAVYAALLMSIMAWKVREGTWKRIEL